MCADFVVFSSRFLDNIGIYLQLLESGCWCLLISVSQFIGIDNSVNRFLVFADFVFFYYLDNSALESISCSLLIKLVF